MRLPRHARIVALFVVMELISNNLIEVVLYGASTGISIFMDSIMMMG